MEAMTPDHRTLLQDCRYEFENVRNEVPADRLTKVTAIAIGKLLARIDAALADTRVAEAVGGEGLLIAEFRKRLNSDPAHQQGPQCDAKSNNTPGHAWGWCCTRPLAHDGEHASLDDCEHCRSVVIRHRWKETP